MLVPAAAGVLSASAWSASDERRERLARRRGRSPTRASCPARARRPALSRTVVRAPVPLRPGSASAFHRAHEQRYGYADSARSSSSRCALSRPPGARSPRRGDAVARRRPAAGRVTARRAGCPPAGRARRTTTARGCTSAMKVELQVSAAPAAVAEEMGVVLIRAAFSANIKERRDCSCALRRRGRMVAQAEHIPVHLGAMPDAVAAVLAPARCPARLDRSTIPSPAARTCPTSRSSRAPRSATPSPAPTTPMSAGSSRPPSRLFPLLCQEGLDYPTHAARRRPPPASSSRTAEPGRAPRRPPRPARCAASGGARVEELCAGVATSASPRRWTSSTPTRSAGARRDRPAARMAARGPATSSSRWRATSRSTPR